MSHLLHFPLVPSLMHLFSSYYYFISVIWRHNTPNHLAPSESLWNLLGSPTDHSYTTTQAFFIYAEIPTSLHPLKLLTTQVQPEPSTIMIIGYNFVCSFSVFWGKIVIGRKTYRNNKLYSLEFRD